MPPRKVAARSSSRGQTILSFKTPGKITKSQPFPSIKKDISSTKKPTVVPSISTSPPPPDASDAAEVPTAPFQKDVKVEPVSETEEKHIIALIDDDSTRTYYKEHILAGRCVPPLHQEALSIEEKVLRHFDLSPQYGPCIGISRLSRWRRAKGLGMEPPVEVLAVCLKMERDLGGTGGKEKEGGSGEVVGCGVDRKRDTRRSYLDDFLSTRTARE